MNKSIVIYGPQGTGKTLNAERIAKHFNLGRIIELDGFKDETRISADPMDVLFLTNTTPAPHLRRVMLIDVALARLNGPRGYPF